MEKVLVERSKKIFKESPEKWNAFIELSKLKDQIIADWYDILRSSILDKLISDNIQFDKKWEIKKTEKGKIEWVIELEGRYFSFGFDKSFVFFWIDSRIVDSKMLELLDSGSFEYLNEIFKTRQQNTNFLMRDDDLLDFEFLNDGLKNEKFAWYAGNCTKELVEQIVNKLKPFWKSDFVEELKRFDQELNK